MEIRSNTDESDVCLRLLLEKTGASMERTETFYHSNGIERSGVEMEDESPEIPTAVSRR